MNCADTFHSQSAVTVKSERAPQEPKQRKEPLDHESAALIKPVERGSFINTDEEKKSTEIDRCGIDGLELNSATSPAAKDKINPEERKKKLAEPGGHPLSRLRADLARGAH